MSIKDDSKKTPLDFDEYIRQGEPGKKEKASIWQTAIGLQAVDGLQTSDYLKDTARRHIEGEISIDEARELIKSYYQSKTLREPGDDEKQEADKVSANITKILSSQTLDFSSGGYISVHRRVFEGVFKHAGKLRNYDITKREWVLNGDTVNYLNWEDLRRALDYDIAQEREFSYKGISSNEMIQHCGKFMLFVRVTPGQQLSSPFSICAPLDLKWIMISLPVILGTSEMHWFVPITRMHAWASTTPPSI